MLENVAGLFFPDVLLFRYVLLLCAVVKLIPTAASELELLANRVHVRVYVSGEAAHVRVPGITKTRFVECATNQLDLPANETRDCVETLAAR
ncbi:hypothetical protein MTO96_044330 [Rhipicephalus appendiculatus]